VITQSPNFKLDYSRKWGRKRKAANKFVTIGACSKTAGKHRFKMFVVKGRQRGRTV
jgi:hypothetical protein